MPSWVVGVHIFITTGIFTGSRELIRRRMRYLDLQTVTRMKFKPTTDSRHNKPVAASLLKQKFLMFECKRLTPPSKNFQ
tara:strand:+ start:1096 stop:1332 length:237 start_codon:yes stop_codon:yes gene_type:complete